MHYLDDMVEGSLDLGFYLAGGLKNSAYAKGNSTARKVIGSMDARRV